MTFNILHNNINRFHEVLDGVATIDGNNVYHLNPEIGSGSFKWYPGEHWDLYIGQFKLLQNFTFNRLPNPDNSEKYAISFQTFKNLSDSEFKLKKGIRNASDGILFYSGAAEVKSFWHRNTECQRIQLTFSRTWIKELEESHHLPGIIANLLDQRPNPMFHVPINSEMKHTLRQMFYPPGDMGIDFETSYMYNKAISLFISAAGGTVQRINQQVKKYSIHPDDLNILEQVKVQLINGYQKPPTVKQLVDQTGMSKSKLQRLFHTVYDTSVYQFIKNVRMEKAMELLMQGFSVTEAGYDVGYSSIPNFSAAFKEHFNIQPGQVSLR